jgi:hypothetical protein
LTPCPVTDTTWSACAAVAPGTVLPANA